MERRFHSRPGGNLPRRAAGSGTFLNLNVRSWDRISALLIKGKLWKKISDSVGGWRSEYC